MLEKLAVKKDERKEVKEYFKVSAACANWQERPSSGTRIAMLSG